MKSLEEIKKGLECCLDDCERVGNCPYSGTFGCDECLKRDAFAYIEQLEERCERLLRTAEMLNDALQEYQEIPRWIPVEERLPEKMKIVLVFKRRTAYFTWSDAMWNIETDWRGEDDWSKNPHNGCFAVTHWMPLPEPPKKEDKK